MQTVLLKPSEQPKYLFKWRQNQKCCSLFDSVKLRLKIIPLQQVKLQTDILTNDQCRSNDKR